MRYLAKPPRQKFEAKNYAERPLQRNAILHHKLGVVRAQKDNA
jgi:hypothetical protein